MDEEGLKQLCLIASSPKKHTPMLHGRPVIGKFGIGKLSTYVLANKLTYICKDGSRLSMTTTIRWTTRSTAA